MCDRFSSPRVHESSEYSQREAPAGEASAGKTPVWEAPPLGTPGWAIPSHNTWSNDLFRLNNTERIQWAGSDVIDSAYRRYGDPQEYRSERVPLLFDMTCRPPQYQLLAHFDYLEPDSERYLFLSHIPELVFATGNGGYFQNVLTAPMFHGSAWSSVEIDHHSVGLKQAAHTWAYQFVMDNVELALGEPFLRIFGGRIATMMLDFDARYCDHCTGGTRRGHEPLAKGHGMFVWDCHTNVMLAAETWNDSGHIIMRLRECLVTETPTSTTYSRLEQLF